MARLLKVSLSLFICSLIAFGCHPKHNAQENFAKHHKKRPASPLVKSLKTYTSATDSLHPKATEYLVQDEMYDDKGQRIKLVHYFGDSGKIDYTTTYQYDGKGNIIQTHNVLPFDKMETTEKNTYDNDKHIIKTEWSKSDGSYGTHEYKYDKQGTMIQWDDYEKGHFMVTRLYPMTYDKEDRIVESFAKEVHGSKDTVAQGHERYEYDSTTGLEAAKMVLFGEEPLEIVESQYDTAQNKILEIHYERDSTGSIKPNTRIMNVFNEYGEITNTTTFKNGSIVSKTENKYDTYGHIIESDSIEGGTTKMTKYIYDFYK